MAHPSPGQASWWVFKNGVGVVCRSLLRPQWSARVVHRSISVCGILQCPCWTGWLARSRWLPAQAPPRLRYSRRSHRSTQHQPVCDYKTKWLLEKIFSRYFYLIIITDKSPIYLKMYEWKCWPQSLHTFSTNLFGGVYEIPHLNYLPFTTA